MHTFDLSGLDDLTLTDERPIVREPDNFWFYGTGKRKRIAHCPTCGDPLMLFIQDKRLAFYCWDCKLVWLTGRRETQYVRSHDTLVQEIVDPDLIDDSRFIEPDYNQRYYQAHRDDILAHKARKRAEESAA